jgi:hypothetical protein
LPGIGEKNFSLNFKRYYLIIRVVNFCETFCTCSPSLHFSLKVKKSEKKFIWAS